jgi:hypothetical protein
MPKPAAPRRGGGSGDLYADTGSGHWIQNVSSDGAVVTLEDGSLWSIDGADRYMTAIWLVVDDITVRDDAGSHYTLINTDEGETAAARYLGS